MTEYVECENGMKTWKCRTQEDSIYNFVAGAYETDTFTASDTNIHFVYGKAYEQAVRQYDINQAVKAVFAYCYRH